MNSGWRYKSTLAVLLLLVGCFMTAAAQDADTTSSYPPSSAGQTNTDPPGRVARIQYMSGEVSIQPGGVNDWIAADMNRPLTTSDRVWTDKNSKAELSVGGGYLRLNSESSLTLTNVSDNTVQVELYQGTLEMSVRYLGPGQIYEVDTPNLAFTVMKPGVYSFNVFADQDQTWVTVRKGYGEATGQGPAVKVKAGEQVRFNTGTSLQNSAQAAPPPDGFDEWASVRDKRLDSSESARYVSPGVIGSEDLDTYGSWQTIAPYGPVWMPNSVPVGWAPYRFGHWVWIAPWGWTWVDDAPWGFAPFHYGRWVNTGGYWGWAPGPYRYWSPCYAPALVAWVGGPGFGVGFGFGGAGWGVGVNFGWFPLGWGEPYYPWYHGRYGRGLSSTYIRNVNVTNTYIRNANYITNNYRNNNFNNFHYVNRTVNGAVTAAPASAIAGGQQINRFGHAVPSSGLMHAPVMRSINATPTHASYLGGQQPRETGIPNRSTFNRTMVTRATPPSYARPSTMQARNSAPAQAAGAPSTAFGGRSASQSGNLADNRVPRPPTATFGGRNDYAARPGTASTAGAVTHPYVPRPGYSPNKVPAGQSASAAASNSHLMYPSAEPRSVPRSGAPSPPHATAPSARPSAPAHQASPAPHSSSGPSSRSPQASGTNIPQPPTGDTYRAAPEYAGGNRSQSGMTSMGSRTAGNNSYASARTNSVAPNYNVRGTYGATKPYIPSSRGYSATPSRAYQSGGYSAPHYSAPGGGGHYSAPSGGGHGGGSAQASHSGGGGHGR